MTTMSEQQPFYVLLLMPFWFLLRRLRDFLRRPFRLSLKAPQSGLSMQVERRPSDERYPPTTEPSEKPTSDAGPSIARRTEPYEKDSTTVD